MADIQIRGLPADEHHVLTIGESRTISIPALFQGAADLRSASACILFFEGQVLLLCWSKFGFICQRVQRADPYANMHLDFLLGQFWCARACIAACVWNYGTKIGQS